MTLKELAKSIVEKKYSRIPEHARPVLHFTDANANGLTKAMLAYFDFKGVKAWRQVSEGRYIQGRHYKDFNGRTKQEGGMYIPRAKAAKGIGDVSAVVNGQFTSWEVKIGKDRQSDDQKRFQAEIEASGGKYFLVRSWEEFIAKAKQLS